MTPKITNLEQLKQFMRMKPTLEDTAAFFDVDPTTVARTIKENFGKTFTEFRQQNMVHTRHALIRKAIEKALAGDNTMLIFTLKNMCGWSDKYDDGSNNVKEVIQLRYATKKKLEKEKKDLEESDE